jgi:hypothetical protein
LCRRAVHSSSHTVRVRVCVALSLSLRSCAPSAFAASWTLARQRTWRSLRARYR